MKTNALVRIPTYGLKPVLNMAGQSVKLKDGTIKTRRFWPGRKPSKYTPHVGKKQLAKQAAKLATKVTL